MSRLRILLVEDDENLGFVLQETLELQGYDVTRCLNGEAGQAAFEAGHFDLCLLDVMMPATDGFTLGKAIRRLDTAVPIIFLTAKSLKEDRIEGFRIGGDDYVTKPFSMEELLLRIQAVLKRSQPSRNDHEAQAPRRVGQFIYHPAQDQLRRGDDVMHLTHKESALLDLLTRHPGTLLRRNEALNAIWGEESFFTGRSMDVYISRLRKLLRADKTLEIVNVHGEGYKLRHNKN